MKSIPNILTVIRILMTPLFVICLLEDGWQLYAVLIFGLASLTDWYDGYLARRYGITSDWGKFLDPLADKILVLSAFFSFVYLGIVKLWMVMVIVMRDFIVTGLRSYNMRRGKPMITNLLAKTKTFTQMTMIIVILLFIALKSLLTQFAMDVGRYIEKTVSVMLHYEIIYAGMLLVTVLTAVSGLIYLYQNRDSLRRLASFVFKNS
ncbi:CDP-diacylglycerol--glycerol-3-phosphate 3-phosphatidyltransferase [bacterium]|nr:MAG: CDP-diacylglycerol--glycerol-3-phosphate 3-phosphatidyltransferase [bacterium]